MSKIKTEECPECGSVGGLFICSFSAVNCANCGEFIRIAKEDELDQMEPIAKAFKKTREDKRE